jgi:hypothetical protein
MMLENTSRGFWYCHLVIMSLPTYYSPVIDLWTFPWIPAPSVLTSFQIKVVINDHRQNINLHKSNQKHMCTNSRKQNRSSYNICHTHTHTHKTGFSIVDADNDASELTVSHNVSHDKRVLVFNENIISYLFMWYTEHSTEPVWSFFTILYAVQVHGTVNAGYFL